MKFSWVYFKRLFCVVCGVCVCGLWSGCVWCGVLWCVVCGVMCDGVVVCVVCGVCGVGVGCVVRRAICLRHHLTSNISSFSTEGSFLKSCCSATFEYYCSRDSDQWNPPSKSTSFNCGEYSFSPFHGIHCFSRTTLVTLQQTTCQTNRM